MLDSLDRPRCLSGPLHASLPDSALPPRNGLVDLRLARLYLPRRTPAAPLVAAPGLATSCHGTDSSDV